MSDYTPEPLVYIAGPYSSDPVGNTRRAITAAEEIEWAFNVATFIPHLTLLWDLVSPAPVQKWYERDLHVLARCDALWRLPGSSTGADLETAFAEDHGIPVFEELRHGTAALFGEWREQWSPDVRRAD